MNGGLETNARAECGGNGSQNSRVEALRAKQRAQNRGTFAREDWAQNSGSSCGKRACAEYA
eukprot:1630024-Pleurochrysis_carterae.AAC.1